MQYTFNYVMVRHGGQNQPISAMDLPYN